MSVTTIGNGLTIATTSESPVELTGLLWHIANGFSRGWYARPFIGADSGTPVIIMKLRWHTAGGLSALGLRSVLAWAANDEDEEEAATDAVAAAGAASATFPFNELTLPRRMERGRNRFAARWLVRPEGGVSRRRRCLQCRAPLKRHRPRRRRSHCWRPFRRIAGCIQETHHTRQGISSSVGYWPWRIKGCQMNPILPFRLLSTHQPMSPKYKKDLDKQSRKLFRALASILVKCSLPRKQIQ